MKKHMLQILLAAFLIIIIGAIGIFLYYQRNSAKTETLSNGLTIIHRMITEKGDQSVDNKKAVYLINVEFPEIAGLQSKETQSLINRKTRSIVDLQITNFKGGLSSIRNEENSLDVSFEIIGSTNRYISLQFEATVFFSGALHNQYWLACPTFDLISAKEINLTEIFEPSKNPYAFLSTYCRNDLRRQLGKDANEEMLKTGTEPLPENFKHLNLSSDKNLIVTFDSYQVADFASGILSVEIPFKEYKTIVNPKASFLK